MKILFIHPNFPGQFKHLAASAAASPSNQVVFACRHPNDHVRIARVVKRVYEVSGTPGEGTHRYLRDLTRAVYAGQSVWRLCRRLEAEGFVPDIVCCHPGWGEGLFLKDVYPEVPLLSYLEFYYRAFGADVHFDPHEQVDPDAVAHLRMRNASHLLNLEACDWGLTPTRWQWSRHPAAFRDKISVLHEGIDLQSVRPGPANRLTLPDGTVLTADVEVITYVARSFEPLRGFPQFIRALELILQARPGAHALVVGGDEVRYGRPPAQGGTWREAMLDEVRLDQRRVHWLGTLPYAEYLKVLKHSSAHVYLTVPFVLSWSMLEAMAMGCTVVASDTAPVTEVIEEGVNGLLFDFFSHEQLAARVCEALDRHDELEPARRAARETIRTRYDLKTVLPLQRMLLEDLARRRIPPPAAEAIAAHGKA